MSSILKFLKRIFKKTELPTISSHDYVISRQCVREFWLKKKYQVKSNREIPVYISSIERKKIRELLNKKFENLQNANFSISNTLSLIQKQKNIENCSLKFQNYTANADFLIFDDVTKSYNLIYFKTSKKLKDRFFQESSFTKYILDELNVPISKYLVYLINSDFTISENANLFNILDLKNVTDTIQKIFPFEKQKIQELNIILKKRKFIKSKNSPICHLPSDCISFNNCYPKKTLGDLYTLRDDKKDLKTLFNKNKVFLRQIKNINSFSPIQQIQIQVEKSNLPHIDKEKINEFLSKINYPIHFLDFETINPLIPQFSGLIPLQHMPFQYSLHVKRSEKSSLEYFSFLNTSDSDPRKLILENLQKLIDANGSIICFNTSFESNVLLKCVEHFTDYKNWFKKIRTQFIDIADPFKKLHYYHPLQKGNTSLKSILPILTEETFNNFEISSGYQANQEYLKTRLENLTDEEKNKIYENLLEYNKLDTFALTLILDKLKLIAS